jgi:hypothetical protein
MNCFLTFTIYTSYLNLFPGAGQLWSEGYNLNNICRGPRDNVLYIISGFIHIDSGGRVHSDTSVCMKGFYFLIIILYEITTDVWCVANKTLVSTTKVKVTVEVQTLSFFILYKYRWWWPCPLWNFSMHEKIFFFFYEITIDILCVANKTQISTS